VLKEVIVILPRLRRFDEVQVSASLREEAAERRRERREEAQRKAEEEAGDE
jgi:hypothetical protein